MFYEYLGFLAVLILFFSFEVSFVGYYQVRCGFHERILFLISGLLMAVFIFTHNYAALGVGLSLFAVCTLFQRLKRLRPA